MNPVRRELRQRKDLPVLPSVMKDVVPGSGGLGATASCMIAGWMGFQGLGLNEPVESTIGTVAATINGVEQFSSCVAQYSPCCTVLNWPVVYMLALSGKYRISIEVSLYNDGYAHGKSNLSRVRLSPSSANTNSGFWPAAPDGFPKIWLAFGSAVQSTS